MSPGGEMDQSEYRLEGDVALVDVSGDIDVLTSGALRDRLLAVVGKGHDGLVVNLGNVDFIDSTGIGVLIGVWRRMQAGRRTLALAAPSRRTRRIFDTAGVSEIFFIYDSVGEAVQACCRSPGG
jgi:anti-sigma B factor antagonist